MLLERWPTNFASIEEYNYRTGALDGFTLRELWWRRRRIQNSLMQENPKGAIYPYWQKALQRIDTELRARGAIEKR